LYYFYVFVLFVNFNYEGAALMTFVKLTRRVSACKRNFRNNCEKFTGLTFSNSTLKEV